MDFNYRYKFNQVYFNYRNNQVDFNSVIVEKKNIQVDFSYRNKNYQVVFNTDSKKSKRSCVVQLNKQK